MHKQTLYYGGSILTMENIDDNPEAVLVEDTKIKAVGKLKELESMAQKNVQKVDLDGKCLMPAFVDAHSHIMMNAQMSLFADLSDCSCFDDVVKTLKAYIDKKQLEKGKAIIGFGYDHNFLVEYKHPTKEVLDRVSTEHPIFVTHISGHVACANSLALDLAGVTSETVNPEGGVIGRCEGTQEPNGYFEEAAMKCVQGVISKRIDAGLTDMMRNMFKIYVKNGVTTIQEGAATAQTIKTLKFLSLLKKFPVDVVAYPMIADEGVSVLKKNRKYVGEYHRGLKIGGYKLILDGSPQARSAWLSKPYLNGDEDYCGYPWMKSEAVEEYIKIALKEGRQVLAHCNGDAASEQFITCYENALTSEKIQGDLRPVMIHCQTVRPDQIKRMKALNMMASVFVGHVFYWGDVHMKNMGEDRGNNISPVKCAMDEGLVVNFHQDTPVTKPKMLHSVWCAVNRISRNGNIIGAHQAVSVYDALRAVTINAAYEYFEENSKGSIKTGKNADLVILDKNPLLVDKMNIKDIKVLETIKDGKIIYSV